MHRPLQSWPLREFEIREHNVMGTVRLFDKPSTKSATIVVDRFKSA